MKKLFCIVFMFIAIFLSGCLAFHDMQVRKGIESGQIKLGSSKSEVSSVVGDPYSWCIKKKMAIDGNYELWDFASRGCARGNLTESYAFVFKNGRLVEIRTVHNPSDLQL